MVDFIRERSKLGLDGSHLKGVQSIGQDSPGMVL